MKKKQLLFSVLLTCSLFGQAAEVAQSGNGVTVRPDGGQARVVRLEVIGDKIVRVRATSKDMLPEKQKSLIIVDQTARPRFTVSDAEGYAAVKTAQIEARVDKRTGEVTFLGADGKTLLREAKQGKRFQDYYVSDREIGVSVAKVPEEQRHGLTWQTVFDSPADEAFYGLGQHQSQELNMKGRNEDLFQYNTKVSVPFVISNKNYGLLWDSYSYCRFGQPVDYLQLNQAFKLYDKKGREGHLTGTYTDKDGKTVVRDEDSLYYEFACPPKSELGNLTEPGGTKNLPKGFNLDGAKVVYEGFIEPREAANAQRSTLNAQLREFILYYAGYVKVFIGGREVVPEMWRTSWNPNSYKFTCDIPKGELTQLRIEWQPDGGESYIGLRVARQRTEQEQGQLSIWNEMSPDMDYYFIAGASMDEVISGYRTLTGRAPVYPKWVMGFWQSRERYKTQDEIVQTLAAFRQRHIPIDNIVQDWNYWADDQWGSHEFEASRYPDPQAMLDSVHQMHGRFMISVWPKLYCNTDNYKELDAHGWMYQQSPTDDIRDWVGPGYRNSFYDAYSPDARKMFWRQMDEKLYTGLSGKTENSKSSNSNFIDAWWMDASEPNVRDCTPMWYRKALSGPTALGTTTEYFNAYALMNAQGIYEGQRGTWRQIINGKSVNRKLSEPRVFQLTRSGFAGLQRYSTATWSGDIGTRWEDMRAQMTAGMNYSLAGLPYWGMDIGGFCVERRYMAAQQLYDRDKTENEDLREWRELQTRWNQFGCFVPLYRTHGQWPLREVWNIAPESHPAYQSIVWYDQLRYHLMPYLYSMAGWVHLKDYTMMRALVMDFGSDSKVLDIKDQWMFGPSLMACPVSEYKARSRAVYFPKQCDWYDLYTGEQIVNSKLSNRKLIVEAPYERIPVFVPGGSIIPFGPAMEWSDEKPAELINLYVYSGRDAQFTLYEDEGTNYNYEKGKFATIDIRYDDSARTITIGQRKGSFDGMLKQRRFNIVYITPDSPKALNMDSPKGVMVEYNGKEMTIQI